MDALIVAVQMIAKHTVSEKTGKPLKYDKKIYIFTNGNGPIDQDGSELVTGKLDEEQIKLSDALDLINQQTTKQVKPTTTFRGNLTLGDPENIDTSLRIPIWIYNKTSVLTLPTAKKQSKPGVELGGGKIEIISSPKLVKEEKDEEMERIKSFRYGKHLIPFIAEDEESAQLETEKSLSIITFVPKEKIKREYYMGNVLAVIKDPTSKSVQLDSIVEACKLNNVVGIARYVRTDKAAVKMCALIPNRKGYFYMIQLPYQNDIYHFHFSTLPTPKKDLSIEQALDEFINSNEQSLMPKEIFNPVYQQMIESIVNRAMGKPLPEIQPMFDYKLDDKKLKPLFEITKIIEKPKGKIKNQTSVKEIVLDDLDDLWSDDEKSNEWETVNWKKKEEDDFVLLEAQKVLGKPSDEFVLVDKSVALALAFGLSFEGVFSAIGTVSFLYFLTGFQGFKRDIIKDKKFQYEAARLTVIFGLSILVSILGIWLAINDNWIDHSAYFIPSCIYSLELLAFLDLSYNNAKEMLVSSKEKSGSRNSRTGIESRQKSTTAVSIQGKDLPQYERQFKSMASSQYSASQNPYSPEQSQFANQYSQGNTSEFKLTSMPPKQQKKTHTYDPTKVVNYF
ncbi:X-ray repair cross-complementing protein 5 [Boothiomyces macroporosus]|uniref:X-ray repair cross-complementing protein 5 n=1 Tax=Boothiomyces macroporosus TaxID=261099 RepID=A0AAD5Y3D0_9FUNG|nr:X-ray repair cross-complementing protein 5 [Boothiomyces macroporosus]